MLVDALNQRKPQNNGYFQFRSANPCSYPIPTDGYVGQLLYGLGRHPFRPAHIRIVKSAEGFETSYPNLFVESDPYLDTNAVFGVKQPLIVPLDREKSSKRATAFGVSAPFYHVEYDFKLCVS